MKSWVGTGSAKLQKIRHLDKGRLVYKDLVDAFRVHFGEAKKALDGVEYVKILRRLRLRPRARLAPDQAVRVFNHMMETLNARQ